MVILFEKVLDLQVFIFMFNDGSQVCLSEVVEVVGVSEWLCEFGMIFRVIFFDIVVDSIIVLGESWYGWLVWSCCL